MNDFDSMFYTLKQTLEHDPGNVEALEQIWMSVELSKKYNESIELHNKLIDKQPYSHLAWFNLGHAFSCIGEYENAIHALEFSYLIDPDFESGYMDCAEICMQLRQFNKAYEIYNEANEVFGPDAEIMIYMVECKAELKDYQSVRELALEALGLDSYNDELYFYLAESYKHLGDMDMAKMNYLKAMDIDAEREDYYAGIAEVYEAMGDLVNANLCYRQTTIIAPEQNTYWFKYVKFLLNCGKVEKAKWVLEEAEDNSVGIDLEYAKVACLLLSDSPDEAMSLLESLIKEDLSFVDEFMSIHDSFKQNNQLVAMINYYKGE